jgi:hypothetical protein
MTRETVDGDLPQARRADSRSKRRSKATELALTQYVLEATCDQDPQQASPETKVAPLATSDPFGP